MSEIAAVLDWPLRTTIVGMAEADPGNRANRLLGALPDVDRARLLPELEPVELQGRAAIHHPGDPLEYVYFPLSGLASTVARSADGMTVEALTVGRHGTTGVLVLAGWESAPAAMVQHVAGSSLRMATAAFRAELERDGAMLDLVRRYARFEFLLMTQLILCAGVHTLHRRAARGLLECHDAVDGDSFNLTHEDFATKLGVHRPSVSIAARALQEAGVIEYARGRVNVLDRERLEAMSCECYDAIVSGYEQVFGSDPTWQ